MVFNETILNGSFIIEVEKLVDDRGFFGRSFCEKEFAAQQLPIRYVQSNISYNEKKGTLRGLHFQTEPFQEDKLVRCSRGAIYDVILDLRKSSSTYMKWLGIELTATNYKMLFIPKGFAHGFITLEDDTEILYHMTEFYQPGSERGYRWNDPAFNIKWPFDPSIIAEKDTLYPLFGNGH